MRVYVAGVVTRYPMLRALRTVRYPNLLGSFAYPETLLILTKLWAGRAGPRYVMWDSGAFTVHQNRDTRKVREISREAYLAFALEMRAGWGKKLEALEFITFDVVGDQTATRRNTEWLWGKGLDVLPVVTLSTARPQDVRWAMEHGPRFALGGLDGARLGLRITPSIRRPLLDRVWTWWRAEEQRTGHQAAPHLLGKASLRLLTTWPVASCDVTSWLMPNRWGVAKAMLGHSRAVQLPRTTKGVTPPARDELLMHGVYVAELEKLVGIARTATRAWTARGVTIRGY